MTLFGHYVIISPWGFVWLLDGGRRALTWAEAMQGRRFS